MDNLLQIPAPLWAVAALIIVIFATLIWLRRRNFQLRKVELSAGPVKGVFESDTSATATEQPSAATTPRASVNISGNAMLGKNEMRVRRDDVNISDNLVAGENKIDVDTTPPAKADKTRKGTTRR